MTDRMTGAVVVLWCTAAGLTWAVVAQAAGAAWFWEMAPNDAVRVLHVVVLWPLFTAFAAGRWLYAAGAPIGMDVLMDLAGAAAGALVGAGVLAWLRRLV